MDSEAIERFMNRNPEDKAGCWGANRFHGWLLFEL